MKLSAKDLWELTKNSFSEFIADKCPKLGAALAYYTMFSIAPLLLIVMAIAGAIFGEEAVRGEVIGQIQGLIGQQGADVIQTMLQSASDPEGGTLATIIGAILLAVTATGVFVELQDSLNMIWNVKLKENLGIMAVIKDRILSFAMIVAFGFLLMASLVVSAGLSFVLTKMGNIFPLPGWIAQGTNFIVTLAVFAVVFAMIFKYLPDAEIKWKDVWIGAILTAILFAVGKFAIGLYIGNSAVGSSYGAAGAFAVLMVWIYWTAQILFLGAEFTQVYTMKYGSGLEPKGNAVAIANPLEKEEVKEKLDGTYSPGKKISGDKNHEDKISAEEKNSAQKKEKFSSEYEKKISSEEKFEVPENQLEIKFPDRRFSAEAQRKRYAQKMSDKPVHRAGMGKNLPKVERKSTYMAAGVAAALYLLNKFRN